MLDISKITYVTSMSDQHKQKRLGRITASCVSRLIGEKSHQGKFTKGAITYIEHLAYERMNGRSAKSEFTSDYTDYGNANEPFAIKRFCSEREMTVLRDENDGDTHRFIEYDDYIACTPDSLVCLTGMDNLFDDTGTKIKVAPLEVKCPPVHYIKFFKCNTPEDVKKVQKEYYWQVLHQMFCCNSAIGYFTAYHPDFNGKESSRIIDFNRLELFKDYKHLSLTLEHAKEKIKETVQLFKAA